MGDKIEIGLSTLEECDKLQALCESWDDKEILEGSTYDKDHMYRCLTEGDLPPIPNAKRDNFKMFTVYKTGTKDIVGIANIYYEYPTVKDVWIGELIIHRDERKNGYGQEVIDLLSKKFKREGYLSIGIGVYLKNWRGLRFWTRVGFDEIRGIYGDKDYGENSFALMSLRKDLSNI